VQDAGDANDQLPTRSSAAGDTLTRGPKLVMFDSVALWRAVIRAADSTPLSIVEWPSATSLQRLLQSGIGCFEGSDRHRAIDCDRFAKRLDALDFVHGLGREVGLAATRA